MFVPPPPATEAAGEPPQPSDEAGASSAGRAKWQPPPPLPSWSRYPVTTAVGLAAIAASVAWWGGVDLEFLYADVRAWHGQPWRLLTSALLHVDLIHLAFNLYWFWAFGTRLEEAIGKVAGGALMAVLAVGSAAVQYAVSYPGVGLSGVGYGLLTFLGVAGRRDPRFAGTVDARTIALFAGWALACWALTEAGVWHVANAAHAGGAALGLLLGLAVVARGRRRVVWAALAAVAIALAVLGSTVFHAYVNRTGLAAYDLAYLGYLDLEAGRDESAVRRLEGAVALDPDQADWWYNLGIVRMRLDRARGAFEAYDRAFARRPGEERFRQAREEARMYAAARAAEEGYQRQMAGDAAEAARLYEEALTLDERQAQTWFNLGFAYQELGRSGPALDAYRRAATLKPDDPKFRRTLMGLPAPNDP